MSNDYLAMSDEDWLRAMPPAPEAAAEEEEEVVAEAPAEEPAETNDSADAVDQDEAEKEAESEGEEDTEESEQEESQDEEAAEDKDGEVNKEDQAELDYKAAYEKLTKPFKANGKEIQIKDVDDAIALMQMGANYNKKMAALKPNLKLMKLLETNGLMSEDKISYLIDLQNRNPAAISKLIKDSGLDPLDLDESKASEYRPTARSVDDREIELDQVLEEIQESPTYTRTLNVVSRQWDNESKQVIANAPQLLKVINSHMESGIYDQIQAELENERMFGRLNGLSDIEAYRKIGDAIQARGGFNQQGRPLNTAPAKPAVPPSKPRQEDVQKVKDRKRAASPTTAAPAPKNPDFNPLALSDEEFSKLVKTNYL